MEQTSSPTSAVHQLLAPSFNTDEKELDSSPVKLTSRQAVQLKRDLITRAITEETEYLLNNNMVRAIRNDTLNSENEKEIPFLKYFINQYVLTFPFLQQTDVEKFLDKLEIFQDEIEKAELSSDAERSDTTKRKALTLRFIKILVLLFNNSTPLDMNGFGMEKEESQSVSVGKEEIKGKDNRNLLQESQMEKKDSEKGVGNPYFVDIVGVRLEEVKGTFMNSSHAKFIVMLAKEESNQVVYTLKRYDDFKSLLKRVGKLYPLKELPALPAKVKETPGQSFMFRENDRLTLRSVLRRLLSDQEIASHLEVYKFLNENQQELTNEDIEDISQRKIHMLNLAEDRKKYASYIKEKAKDYTKLWQECKSELLKPGGLDEFESILRNTSEMQQLPAHYKGAFEWGKLNLASFLYTFFCTTDDSARFYQALCSTHKLLPYRTISTILKYTNPTSIVKGIIDLLLAQPFGSNSLLQRILTASLMDQAKDTQKEIENIEKKVNDEAICNKIKNFVYSPNKRSSNSKFEEEMSEFDRINLIINDFDIEPELTADSIINYSKAKQWMEQYINDENPQVLSDQNGNLIYQEYYFLEALNQLFILYTRKRDSEAISNLMFQGVTGELMKDLLAIFYGPLAQVYKDANVSDFIMKTSLFVDDLIEVIKKVQTGEIDKNLEAGQLQLFIKLIERHEQEFYHFIHSIYSNNSNGLFKNILSWAEKILNSIRNGIVEKEINLQQIVDESKQDEEFNKGLRKDLKLLNQFTVKRKQRQINNLKKKLMTVGEHDTDMQIVEEEFQQLDFNDNRRNSVSDFGFGNITLDDLRELQEIDHFNNNNGDNNNNNNVDINQQSIINANPSEPMLIYLNDTANTNSNINPNNEKNNNENVNYTITSEDSIKKINSFIKKKEIKNISQEPYPKGIDTIPKLLPSFYTLILTYFKE
ncbi:hypothetical protein K502DRAFT_324276 [Neoconidiobolus thromboides FSU 785]|nr:hypothetical protein K502DRAFT_324276 [Neoconidiobolus thromboides FSU 785]